MPDSKAQDWFLRMDDISGVSQLLPEFFRNKDWGVILAVRESVDAGSSLKNPHYHILLKYKEPRSQSTMGKYLKKIFPNLHGNTDFAFKPLGNKVGDVVKVANYMCKGVSQEEEPDVAFNAPHSNLNTSTLHDNYWKLNNQLSKTTRQAVGFMDRVIAESIEELSQNPNVKPSFRHICEQALRASRGKLNHQQSTAVVQAINWHFHPEEAENNFHLRMLRAFSPS